MRAPILALLIAIPAASSDMNQPSASGLSASSAAATYVYRAGDTMTGALGIGAGASSPSAKLDTRGTGSSYSVLFSTSSTGSPNFAMSNRGQEFMLFGATNPFGAHGALTGISNFTLFPGSSTDAGNLSQTNIQLSGYRGTRGVDTIHIEGWNGSDHHIGDIHWLTGQASANGGQIRLLVSSGTPGATPVRVFGVNDQFRATVNQDDTQYAFDVIPNLGYDYTGVPAGSALLGVLRASKDTATDGLIVDLNNNVWSHTMSWGDGATKSTGTSDGYLYLRQYLTLGRDNAVNGVINFPKSAIINIDSDNGETDRTFSVYADNNSDTGGGVQLFTITETGNTQANPVRGNFTVGGSSFTVAGGSATVAYSLTVGSLVGNVTGNVSGNAATVTTNANLTGPITSAGNATTIDGPIPTGAVDLSTITAALALKAPLESPAFTGNVTIGAAGTPLSIISTGTQVSASTSALANLDSVGLPTVNWTRVGNLVHVFFAVNADPTTTLTATAFELTPPVASGFTSDEDAVGVCSNGKNEPIQVLASVANDTLLFKWTPVLVANVDHRCVVDYIVK